MQITKILNRTECVLHWGKNSSAVGLQRGGVSNSVGAIGTASGRGDIEVGLED